MLRSLHHKYSPKIESVVFGIWNGWTGRINFNLERLPTFGVLQYPLPNLDVVS